MALGGALEGQAAIARFRKIWVVSRMAKRAIGIAIAVTTFTVAGKVVTGDDSDARAWPDPPCEDDAVGR